VLRKDARTRSSVAVVTADPAEVARFDALAEEYWKPDGAFKAIHAFNRVRLRIFLSACAPCLSATRSRRSPSPVRGSSMSAAGPVRYPGWAPKCSASMLPGAT
jgi:2-polyprenyl-6-hydroxyphenyl methylase / 3-demethylubiquinone-9 3-methyltransferase